MQAQKHGIGRRLRDPAQKLIADGVEGIVGHFRRRLRHRPRCGKELVSLLSRLGTESAYSPVGAAYGIPQPGGTLLVRTAGDIKEILISSLLRIEGVDFRLETADHDPCHEHFLRM